MDNIIDFDRSLQDAYDVNELVFDNADETLRDLIYELTCICRDRVLESDNMPSDLILNLIEEVIERNNV